VERLGAVFTGTQHGMVEGPGTQGKPVAVTRHTRQAAARDRAPRAPARLAKARLQHASADRRSHNTLILKS